MPIETLFLSFDAGALGLDAKSDFIARIPAGLSQRKALFQVLRLKLQFPEYFGNNWDALEECLRDLSWLEHNRVVVLHQDLPLLDAKDLQTYLGILSGCARDWKPGEDHEFVAAFPPETYDAICRRL